MNFQTLQPKISSELSKNGFIVIKDFIPNHLVSKLLKEIRKFNYDKQDKNYGKLRKDKRFESEESLSLNIKTLFNEFINPLGKEILGEDNEFSDCQISIIEKGRKAVKDWHIDGTWIAKEGDTLDEIPFFKLLIGVYLTDLNQPNSGNLTISPGGHLLVSNYFDTIKNNKNLDIKTIFNRLFKIQIPSLISVNVLPGDIIIAHSLAPHSVSDNNNKDRPVIYFRLGGYINKGYPALSNLWHEWPNKISIN